MNIHEYQSKKLFREYGLPVSNGIVISSPEKALSAYKDLGEGTVVIKAQVHAGGRGKAGGVKLVSSQEEIVKFCNEQLGSQMVTYQTDEKGQPVNILLIEECIDIEQELYLGAVIDRVSQKIVFMASTEGGVEIEKVAKETPEKIIKCYIDPTLGAQAFQGRTMAFKLGLTGGQVNQFTSMFLKLAKLFEEKDVALMEINPLVIKKDGDLHCLDAKVSFDSNALYRNKDIAEMVDETQDDSREIEAQKWELNYVALDGNIGCMVNGAGLAMGTMDIVKLHGGNPANFLDVGGGATKERVVEAFKIILSDPNVDVVLINIFGGIVRCDLIANGVIDAVKEVEVSIPVVVRLEGNNAEKGRAVLKSSSLNIIAADSLSDAATLAVEAAKGEV